MSVGGRKPSLGVARSGITNAVQRHAQDSGGSHLLSAEPPADISERARPVWNVVAPSLIGTRTLRPEDLYLLQEFCESIALASYYRSGLGATRSDLEAVQVDIDSAEGDLKLLEQLEQRQARLEARLKRQTVGHRDAVNLAARLAGDLGIGPVARVRTGLMNANTISLVEGLNEAAGIDLGGSPS